MPARQERPATSRPRSWIQRFETLMPYRIRDVLLVSSLYDAFILQEDGQISDLLLDEKSEVSLRSAPRITRVPTGYEAIDLMAERDRFDLVIVTPQIGGMAPADFAEEVKNRIGRVPVVLLGYDAGAIRGLLSSRDDNPFDEVFLWNGDAVILRGIITLIEDRVNCMHDSEMVGVQAILLVEDSLNFLSSYLPLLYTEITEQTHNVISECVNLTHKILRMRARPKILLARNLATALRLYSEHREHLLGVITDVGFPRHRRGAEDPNAGFEFVRHVRQRDQNLPILLQSSDPANAAIAKEHGAVFVSKDSPHLHNRMRRFMLDNFGFGPFYFYRPDRFLEGEAKTIRELKDQIARASTDSLIYHAERNSFSIWLRARTEFDLADQLSPKEVADFVDGDDLRHYLLEVLDEARRESQRGSIADFDRRTFDNTINFSRIGAGSLGGKARGLAFINYLLRFYAQTVEHPDVRITVPPAVVLSTEVFDRFMRDNDLYDVALDDGYTDAERRRHFLEGALPPDILRDLATFQSFYRGPLAVRSSSLLEDSHFQPFAGVYETLMTTNEGSDEDRLEELARTIKLVYASAFTSRARSYIRATPYLHEEEKMAVVVQQLFGRARNGRYYPSFSGVARSHNYYPHGNVSPDDGVVSVALGLGKLVVAGEGGLRFCPKYPQSLPDFSSVDDILQNAQRNFYALPMDGEPADALDRQAYQPSRYDVRLADEDGTLAPLASVFSPEDGRISDGVSRHGHRLVTFANVLKHGTFPLPELAASLLDIGARGMGCPVEIEFAVDLEAPRGRPRELALLQMRPMVVAHEHLGVELEGIDETRVVCSSDRTFGNGRIDDIGDILLVDPAEFDRSRSADTATAIGEMNAALQRERRPFLLIGPGRWGSNDPWLGIPVDWSQIAGARVVIETGFENYRVKPSEGSHFFHNMTSFHVGYFTLNPQAGEGVLDLDWLRSRPVAERKENGLVRIRLDEPLLVLLDGSSARGAVLKP